MQKRLQRKLNGFFKFPDGKVELLIECINKKCKEYFLFYFQNIEARASE